MALKKEKNEEEIHVARASETIITSPTVCFVYVHAYTRIYMCVRVRLVVRKLQMCEKKLRTRIYYI